MAAKNIQKQIDEINGKLDVILEEIEYQRRHRREMDDLKDDLTRVGKDLYLSTVDELEEVHDHINTGDMMYLGKKVLRNITNITKMFEQLESITDFVHDVTPLTREYILDFMKKMDEFDRKGYFEFLKESAKIIDKVVTEFPVQELKIFENNIIAFMNTIKNLTQPEMLESINKAVDAFKEFDFESSKDVSLFKLLREVNTPEIKRSLALGIQILKGLSKKTKENNLIKVNSNQQN
ncbi:MAG: DUF1641 domain-containing protein [Ignavibacteria bacterium]|nr:DUF1641 domain-containing protein [Ignavibacteria bacterium]